MNSLSLMIYVLAGFGFCEKYHYQKQLVEEEVYLADRIQSIIRGSRGTNWSRDHGGMIQASFPGLLNGLSYIAQVPLPRDDTSHSGLGPLTLISSQENAPTDMPTRPIWGRQLPSWHSLFSGMRLGLCQVYKKLSPFIKEPLSKSAKHV